MKQPDVEFIRLFFPTPAEEAVAVRLAGLFASWVGQDVAKLRPESRMGELWALVSARGQDGFGFFTAMEERLGIDLDPFGDDFGELTFRELVQYAAAVNRPPR